MMDYVALYLVAGVFVTFLLRYVFFREDAEGLSLKGFLLITVFWPMFLFVSILAHFVSARHSS